jgi:hypothetical protein
MTDGVQPVVGSLEAKLIRACTVHDNSCDLHCPEREVVDLGTLARFEKLPADERSRPWPHS